MTVFYAHDDQLDSQRKDQKTKSGSTRHCKYLADRNSASDDGIERIHGDGLVIEMHSNHRALEITGDDCRIVLSKNSGSVHIVGDDCRVRVNHNEGNIEYTGDNGRVLLGSKSVKGKVKFVGDGGKVMTLDSSSETEWKIERKDSRKSSKERLNEANYPGRDTRRRKKVINKTLKPEKSETDVRTLNQEDMDNMANDMKESNGEARKSSRHQTVTKIITKIQTDDQCVGKRFFGGPLFIVNSRSVDPVMKSVSGTLRANIEINRKLR